MANSWEEDFGVAALLKITPLHFLHWQESRLNPQVVKPQVQKERDKKYAQKKPFHNILQIPVNSSVFATVILV